MTGIFHHRFTKSAFVSVYIGCQSAKYCVNHSPLAYLMKNQNRLWRRSFRTLIVLFVLMNAVANFHAYQFTHFSDDGLPKTEKPEKLSTFGKINALVFGISNPRPVNQSKPEAFFETIQLRSNTAIECWYIGVPGPQKTKPAKGTVILFHGYAGEKSSMLDKSDQFLKLGYNTMLVDFMGSGGSEGNQTTLGFREAEQVKTAYDYLTKRDETNIYLFGTSMGAVAILKAIHDYQITPKGIMLECPFGSMYQTTCARFKTMNAPVFPMAGLLVFWGGIQNEFWALGHNPTEYAKTVRSPALLLYGELDKNVSRQEIDDIYANLSGPKKLKTYPLAGHENYLIKYKEQWVQDVSGFLKAR
jgi:alpha-beta hydrolase superfamily lysophospholipase